jgi:hypothetical protein
MDTLGFEIYFLGNRDCRGGGAAAFALCGYGEPWESGVRGQEAGSWGFPFGVTGSRAQPDEAIPAKSGHRVKNPALLGAVEVDAVEADGAPGEPLQASV